MIRQNKSIKGILIAETEYKTSQYADDTGIMIDGDKNSFEETVPIINTFGNKSGLVLYGLVIKEFTYEIYAKFAYGLEPT